MRAHRLDRRRVDLAVEGDDAAERGRRVGRERLAVGVDEVVRKRDTTRIGVLHNHACRVAEPPHAFPRRVAVGKVVVRELLALQLLKRSDRAGNRRFVAIERRGLMRVLAVAQVLDLVALPVPALRKRACDPALVARGQVIADRTVVGGGVRERLLRQPEARRRRKRPGGVAQLGEKHGVVLGIDDDTDVRVILGCRAHQRRSADIDVLDRVLEAAARPRDRLAKRI